MKRFACLFPVLIAGLVACQATTAPGVQREFPLARDVSVPVTVWPSNGQRRILWIGSDHGFPAGMQALAGRLNAKGFEVWQADLLAADFLPLLPSSVPQVTDDNLVELLETVLQLDRRTLVLMSDGQGAKLLARMARTWRRRNNGAWPERLRYTVMVSPVLYDATPAVGREADYVDGIGAIGGTRIVLQPQLSPYYWWLDRTVQLLKNNPGPVSVEVVHGVRDRFYFRPDATDRETQVAAGFGEKIAGLLHP